MGSKQQPTSPGSDNDDRNRKRKLSNRESARRSRMRKQRHLDELIALEKQMQEEIKKLRPMIDDATKLYLNFVSENNVLRAQVAELTERLRSLDSVIRIPSGLSGLAFDVSDTLSEPWKPPCPIQPIPASTNMF